MDIEEGEIIVSDVSSDEDKGHQPQPWYKEKYYDKLETYHNASKSNKIAPSKQFNRQPKSSEDNNYCRDAYSWKNCSLNRPGPTKQHKCSEDSFCRKTFSWKNCLLRNRHGKKPKSRRDSFSDDSVHNTSSQKSPLRYKHNDYLSSHSDEVQELKKRKRKGRKESSYTPKNKTERSHNHSINHENCLTFERQTLRVPSTLNSTITHENRSLMQKLITSGLAKPPTTSSALIEKNLSSSESEKNVKKENVVTDSSKDYNDDSDIEVIIPPKKIPPLVTLDSDGEEMEQVNHSSANADCCSKTEDKQLSLALSDVTNKLSDSSKSLTLDQNERNKGLNERTDFSAKSSPTNKSMGFVIDTSDSHDSELVYSPSSPSTIFSGENIMTSTSNQQSPTKIFEDYYCKDYSSASNEEISSEIWLDQNEQENLKDIDSGRPSSDLNGMNNKTSLSALVENFLTKSTTISNVNRKLDKTESDASNLNHNASSKTDENVLQEYDEPYSPSSEYSYKLNKDDIRSAHIPNTTRSNLRKSSSDVLKAKEICKPSISSVPNCTILSNSPNMDLNNVSERLDVDDEPYSPSSECSYNRHNTSKICTCDPNIENSATTASNQSPIPQEASADDVCLTEICKQSVSQSSEECTSHDEEDDNVSQLRMIALQTKKKTVVEEKSGKCVDKGISETNSEQKHDKPAAPDTLEAVLTVNDEDDDLQLRVAALKSAVMKKYVERKNKGLIVRKRKRAASGFGNDIFTLTESTLEQDNRLSLSPSKSSASDQGEEDMELAESDLGEDVIEEIHSGSVGRSIKEIDHVQMNSSDLSDPTVNACGNLQTSATKIHPTNIPLIVPPQPLPPGVDGDCPDVINQTIFSSVLPPPPPPPPPAPAQLVFAQVLPPPPPPPCPSTQSQPKVSNSMCLKNNSDEQDSVMNLVSRDSTNVSFKEKSQFIEPSASKQYSVNKYLEIQKLKNSDPAISSSRGNLIRVNCLRNMPKPLPTRNNLKKKKRKRNKFVRAVAEPKSSLLCITKLPEKTSVNVRQEDNVRTVNQTNISAEYDMNCEIPMTPGNREDSSVVLCKTNLPQDNYINENHKWNKTKLADLDLLSKSEDVYTAVEDIDLSEMIVLDEVGMSPEHKSSRPDGSHDYTSPYEEDEDTLRVRALTSLSPKQLSNKPTTPVQRQYAIKTTFQNRGKNDLRKVLDKSSVKSKEVLKRRKVVDTSKYRLTRVSSEQRSVLHGIETLKVVVPTSSPPYALPVEQPLPVVQRLVINVDKDSDSEEECEWTRKIRIQETNATVPLGPVVDHELERSIDELLMRARHNTNCDSSSKQIEDGKAKHTDPNTGNKTIEDDSLLDTPLKLLPKEKQEEYKRLKAILEQKEKERQMRKRLTKTTEKSKPLLQHVLINENKKQNQKSTQQDVHKGDDKRERKQNFDERDAENNYFTGNRNVNNDDLSSSIQGGAEEKISKKAQVSSCAGVAEGAELANSAGTKNKDDASVSNNRNASDGLTSSANKCSTGDEVAQKQTPNDRNVVKQAPSALDSCVVSSKVKGGMHCSANSRAKANSKRQDVVDFINSETSTEDQSVLIEPPCEEVENQKELLRLKSNVGAESVKNTTLLGAVTGSQPKEWSQEDLGTKKSELLSERFGLLDDLSEVAESLDDLDSRQKRLEATAMEVGMIRRALRDKQLSLRQQMSEAREAERRLLDSHSAVSARCSSIAHIESTLRQACFEIPTTAQKLMAKKVGQVKEKIDKVKHGRSVVKCLISNPDITDAKLAQLQADFLEKTSGHLDGEEINSLWLQDPKTFHLEDLPVNDENNIYQCLAENDHQKNYQSDDNKYFLETIPEKGIDHTNVETTCGQSSDSLVEQEDATCDVSSTETQSVQQVDQPTTLPAVENTSQPVEGKPCTSNQFAAKDSTDFEYVTKRQCIDNVSVKTGTIPDARLCDQTKTDTLNTRVTIDNTPKEENSSSSVSLKNPNSRFKYRSLLQYNKTSCFSGNQSPSRGTILCPYDLSGRCQDKACKYQHIH